MKKFKELLLLKQLYKYVKLDIHSCIEALASFSVFDEFLNCLKHNFAIDISLLNSSVEVINEKHDAFLSDGKISIVTIFDDEYPRGFMSLSNSKPLYIFAKGNTACLNSKGVSVIGTRHPSSWTQRFGMNISKQIGQISGNIIVSGLALGCDRFAHEGALLAGVPTVAVLPSGINRITPSGHKGLAAKIIEKDGCLISEYEPNASATKYSYIERDRLIAALTDTTFVIECAEKSGTMHTVQAAKSLGRRLICYYPTDDDFLNNANPMDYLGNKKMIDEMGAEFVSNKAELVALFPDSVDTSSVSCAPAPLRDAEILDSRTSASNGIIRRSHLSRAIASADDKAKYDAYVKEILSDKEILARILKYTTEEFKDYAPADIIPCIEEPEVSEIPVERGMTNMRIAGTSTENSTGNEGTISYDIRFSAITPGKERIKILVDAEAQNNYHPGYSLVTRGMFYAARMLSAQLDVEFTADDYDKIKKCYSIWICTEVPEKYADTITTYKTQSKDIYGTFSGHERYDLITVIVIRLGNISSKNNLIRLLDTILSSDLTANRKEEMLEQDFGIMPTIQRKGDMEEMCNLSSGLIEKGKRIGEKSGFDKATRAIACRAYERFRDYEIAAVLADVPVDQVKEWLSQPILTNEDNK